MGLVVAGAPAGAIGHLLVAAQAMLEQPQVPARRISAVANRAAEKVIVRVQVEAVGLVPGDTTGDLVGQVGDDDFVGVNDQHPFVAERKMVEAQFFFLGYVPLKWNCTTCAPDSGSDLLGPVGALAIHDEDFVGPVECGEASQQVFSLVLDRHDHADRALVRAERRRHRLPNVAAAVI